MVAIFLLSPRGLTTGSSKNDHTKCCLYRSRDQVVG
ncbi:palindromic element RPE4 domain-containing protein [Candidatus Rickettsia barbariae]